MCYCIFTKKKSFYVNITKHYNIVKDSGYLRLDVLYFLLLQYISIIRNFEEQHRQITRIVVHTCWVMNRIAFLYLSILSTNIVGPLQNYKIYPLCWASIF